MIAASVSASFLRVRHQYIIFLLCAVASQASIVSYRDSKVDVARFLNRDQPSEFRKQYSEVFHAVGKLSVGCTGWMLTQQLLVTNQHCVEEKKNEKFFFDSHGLNHYADSVCARLKINFAHEKKILNPSLKDELLEVEASKYRCKRIVLANQNYDLAIIELDRPRPAEYKPLKLATSFKSGQEVFLVGHPNGKPKQISYVFHDFKDGRSKCRTDVLKYPKGKTYRDDRFEEFHRRKSNSFQHNCDTAGGSSGSPVIDATTFEIVGLHWDGYVDGHNWGLFDESGRGEWDVHYQYFFRPANFAISAEKIKSFLLSIRPERFESEELRNLLLQIHSTLQ